MNQSENINELVSALAKAQGEMKPAIYNQSQSHFKSKYADFNAIMEACREPLSKHGLAVMQYTDGATADMNLVTMLAHSSGQWIKSALPLIMKQRDCQSLGSAMTYMKRYGLSALLGIVCDEDKDDDGETAVAESRDLFARGTALNTKYNQQDKSRLTIGPKQLEELERELTDYPDIAKMILDGFHLRSLADLPDEKYFPSLDRIREIKKIRTGT